MNEDEDLATHLQVCLDDMIGHATPVVRAAIAAHPDRGSQEPWSPAHRAAQLQGHLAETRSLLTLTANRTRAMPKLL